MARRNPSGLRAHVRQVLAASFLVLAFGTTGAAFMIGYTASIEESFSDPRSPSQQQLAALARLEEDFGYGGFLSAYRSFGEKTELGAGSTLRAFSDRAEANLETILKADGNSATSANLVAELRRLLSPFRSIALYGAGTNGRPEALPSLAELEQQHAALNARIDKAMEALRAERRALLSRALVAAEVAAIASWLLLAAFLFGFAWLLRDALLTPLESLRRSLAAIIAGASSQPLWGIDRKDEIGALARAADCLRQTLAERSTRSEAFVTARAIERLSARAEGLETMLEKAAASAMNAQERMERASSRAAKASEQASEAAGLAREHIQQLADTLENSGLTTSPALFFDALTKAEARLSAAAAVLEHAQGQSDRALAQKHGRDDDGFFHSLSATERQEGTVPDASAVFDSLSSDLEALERFAASRKEIASHEAVMLTAALVEAIDRLNRVADRVSASADRAGEIKAA